MDWIHHVPDPVWAALIGAIIASGVSFVVTILSNRNSRKQLQMQLDENARQRDRERTMTLRRDVYLPATEAITPRRCSGGPV